MGVPFASLVLEIPQRGLKTMSEKTNTEAAFNSIGKVSDMADNFAHAARLPLPAEMHASQLRRGMEQIRDALRMIYRDHLGENPWDE